MINQVQYSISVVIPNYNGRDLLEQNLPLVYNALKSSNIENFEIIIPDDASKDDSVAFIKENYPDIILILNEKNKGFSGNINIGIYKATKNLVFILNSDIQLPSGYFIPLLSYFEREDTFGVMGGIVESSNNEVLFAARYPEYSFGKINPGKNFISHTTNSLLTFFHSGATALVERTKLLELKGFDEVFDPYYYEDDDLGFRAWRLGYKLYYEHSVSCLHSKSSTINKESKRKVQLIYKRNKFYYHYLHFDGVELWYYMIKQFSKTCLRVIIWDWEYAKAYYLFVLSLNKLEKSKSRFRELQDKKEVHISMRDMVKTIKSSLEKLDITRL